VLPLAGDMSVTADVQRCVDAARQRFGQIDILVTCPGSSPGGPGVIVLVVGAHIPVDGAQRKAIMDHQQGGSP
jgi:NAD(P)-dependent dehydrogenase (short-subunit alcohol dehydrogenase family)